jgi:hypothetical protein
MKEEIIAKIVSSIDTSLKSKDNETISFNMQGYTPLPIDKKNFHQIESKETSRKIAFIDGGNIEIVKAPNLSLQFVRVYCCIMQDNKKIFSKKNEFYILVRAINKESKIHYETELFPVTGEILIDKKDLSLSNEDETIKQGINNATITVIGEIARKFSEIALAKEIVNELNEQDLIVLDGSLQATVTNQKRYLNLLYDVAEQKKVIVSALAKTSRLFTTSGNSIIGLLSDIAPKKSWSFHPIVEINNENHKAEMFFVKLHDKSNYIFRFEIHNPNNTEEILSTLANNSRDFTFPGYPYGLILADKFARVSNNEREYFQTLLQVKAKYLWKKIEKHTNAINAHSVLDNIG